jgi:ABC-type nitrate/sulfonate/bicarbonate transport system substrate-binding protein
MALLALIAGLAVVAGYVLRERPSAGAPIPVVIARLQTPHSGLVHIAQVKGYFAAAGVDATIQTRDTGYEAMTEVFAGRADFATSAETPIARALAEGKQPRVIATIFSSQWNSGIVGRRDRGVLQPADLKGKRIGFVFGTATHYMLETFLAFHGIPLGAVDLVPKKPAEMLGALTSGEVDAASIWTPFMTSLRDALADNASFFSPKDFYSETTSLMVRPDYLPANREAVDRVLKALLRAEEFARHNADEAVQIIANVSDTSVQSLKGHGDPLTYDVTLQQSLLLAVENEVRWFLRRGLAPARAFPNVIEAFEVEPLRTLKPAAVSITR